MALYLYISISLTKIRVKQTAQQKYLKPVLIGTWRMFGQNVRVDQVGVQRVSWQIDKPMRFSLGGFKNIMKSRINWLMALKVSNGFECLVLNTSQCYTLLCTDCFSVFLSRSDHRARRVATGVGLGQSTSDRRLPTRPDGAVGSRLRSATQLRVTKLPPASLAEAVL